MEYDDREADAAFLRETPEEAARAIAKALEFLRDEAAAIGMHDVVFLIALARARMRDYRPPTARVRKHH